MTATFPVFTGSDAYVLNACAIAARANGAAVSNLMVERVLLAGAFDDHIAAAAREWRLRVRRVVLRGDWWTQDAGSFVARSAGTGAPIAIVPASIGRYIEVNPETGGRRPVTAEVAAGIDPVAWTFMPPGLPASTSPAALRAVVSRGLRSDVVRVASASLAAALIALTVPIFTQFLIDDVLPAGRGSLLWQVVAIGAVMAGAAAALELFRGIALLRVEARVELNVDVALMDRLLRLPASFFRRYSAGDLATRMVAVSTVRHQLAATAVMALVDGVFAIVSLAAVIHFSPALGAAAAGVAGLTFIGVHFAGRSARRVAGDVAARDGQSASLALQIFAAIGKIRVAGAESRAFERWWAIATAHRQAAMTLGRIENGVATFAALLPAASMAVLMAAAALGSLGPSASPITSPGQFGAALAAFGLFLGAAVQMSAAYLQTIRALPVLARVGPVIAEVPETHEMSSDPGVISGAVELRDVRFRYDAGSAPVLDGVSMRVAAGEMVAIVGRSASGKSTIVRLLLGLDVPESGQVLYDERSLQDVDVAAVRRQLGVVLQNGRIMAGDILGNILGQTTALTVQDAWDAAELAGLAGDIRQLPMGMYTLLNEGATTLSGGQRQRLLIARALARRPRLLILDEATSALDNRTQQQVAENLAALDIARVVIAHRLTTIQRADRIYLLERGRVAETGTYDDLLRNDGPFAQLVRRQQLEGYLVKKQ